MIRHIPRASRIFIGLVIITLLLMYLAIVLSSLQERSFLNESNYLRQTSVPLQQKPHTLLDTTNWVQYQDLNYPLVFTYPPDWKIKTADNGSGFYDVKITPKDSKTSMDFYISKTSFLGFEGLNYKTANFGETPVKMQVVNDTLIGIKKGDYYYTFDGTMTPDFDNEFFTIMQTVKFE